MSQHKKDKSELQRIIIMLQRLRGRRQPALLQDFADEFGVTLKQIRRDLDKLQDCYNLDREPFVDAKGRKRAAVRLEESEDMELPVSRRERFTLIGVLSVFRSYQGTPFWEDVVSLRDKLSETLPQKERDELATFGERVLYIPSSGYKAWAEHSETLDALQDGVMDRRVVRYTYRGLDGRMRGDKKGRPVFLAPYAFLLHNEGLYIAGRSFSKPEQGMEPPGDDEIPSLFAVERFVTADTEKARYVVPKKPLADIFDGPFSIFPGKKGEARETCVIDFSKARRGLVEKRQWAKTQRFEELPDGGVRLTLEVANITRIVSFVLSWGPQARAVAPATLVARVAAERSPD